MKKAIIVIVGLGAMRARPVLANDPRPRETLEDYGPRIERPYAYPKITGSTVSLPTQSKWGEFEDFGWEYSPYSYVEQFPGVHEMTTPRMLIYERARRTYERLRREGRY
jgi:hypothetical protein